MTLGSTLFHKHRLPHRSISKGFEKMVSFRDHQVYLLFLLLVKFHGSGKSEIYSPVQRT